MPFQVPLGGHPRGAFFRHPHACPDVKTAAADARSYLGGPSLANAAFTVFREQPTTRAISEIDTPSERRSLRISAQSSTISTRSLPGSTPARVSRELVKIE
jgi:hypothetical protein